MKLEGFSKYEIYPEQGKVWSYKRNRFIGRKHPKKGYWFVTLSGDDGKVLETSIHRIIWTTVNGDIPEKYEINHIDENKDNNSISNLTLVTRTENMNWGTRNDRVAKANAKPIIGVAEGKKDVIFKSTRDGERNGFRSVHKYINKDKTYMGYKWFYVAD